jgi:hypothetical protein
MTLSYVSVKVFEFKYRTNLRSASFDLIIGLAERPRMWGIVVVPFSLFSR